MVVSIFKWSALPLSYKGAGALDGDRTRDLCNVRVGLVRLGAKKGACPSERSASGVGSGTRTRHFRTINPTLYQMSYSSKRVGSARLDTRKMSRARVSKPRGMFFLRRESAVPSAFAPRSGATWIRTKYLRVGLRRRGARKRNGLHARVRRARWPCGPAPKAGVGCADDACGLVAMERAKLKACDYRQCGETVNHLFEWWRKTAESNRNPREIHPFSKRRSRHREIIFQSSVAEGAGVEPGRLRATRFSGPVSAPRRPRLPGAVLAAGIEPAFAH
jgi:hypothetical protein